MGAASAVRDPAANYTRSPVKSLLELTDLPWLAAAVIVAVGLRLLWVAYVNVDPNDGRFDDSVFYHRVATFLADGIGYADPYGRGPTAQWPPGFPAALAALYKPFGVHLWLAKGLNIAFASITVAATYLLARQVFDRRVAYLGALLLAFFPGQIYFSTLVYAETMFGALFMLVLLLAFVWTLREREARWWHVVIIGVLIGWAALVRAEGAFLVAILVPLWALRVRPWRLVAGYTALAALGAALAMAPWTLRNALEFKEFIPLRPNVADAITRSADPEVEGISFGGEEKRSIGIGLRDQITQPWRIFQLAGRKIGDLYENDADGIRLIRTAPPIGSPRGEGFERALTDEQASFWRGLADRYFFAAGAAALAGAAIALWRRNGLSLVLVIPALGWTVFFAFFNPVSRYHFPLGPVIAVFAAVFVLSVWDAAWAFAWRLVPWPGDTSPAHAAPREAGVRNRIS